MLYLHAHTKSFNNSSQKKKKFAKKRNSSTQNYTIIFSTVISRQHNLRKNTFYRQCLIVGIGIGINLKTG